MNVSKPHPNIQIRTNVSVNLSAAQWELNTNEYPRSIIERVADLLNKRVANEFNKGESRTQVEISVTALSNSFKIYGATDNKTKQVLNQLLDNLYRSNNSESVVV